MAAFDLQGKPETKAAISDCYLQHADDGYDVLSTCAASGGKASAFDQALQRIQNSDALKSILPGLKLETNSNDASTSKPERVELQTDAPKNVASSETEKGATPSETAKDAAPSVEHGASSNNGDAASAQDKTVYSLADSQMTLQDAYNWGRDKVESATPENVAFTSLIMRSQFSKFEVKAPLMEKLNLQTNVSAAVGAQLMYKDTNNFLNTDSAISKVYYGFATASDAAMTIGGLAANIPGAKKYAVPAEFGGLVVRTGMGIGSSFLDIGKRIWKASTAPADAGKN